MSKIVLVEDDLPLAEMVQEFLKIEGYQVFWAGDGEEGERLVLEHQPDLIILDMMLPGIDGFEVCRRLRPEFTGIIIMLTARDEELTEVTALKLGVDDYITKPVRAQILLARIEAQLRRYQQRDQEISSQDQEELDGFHVGRLHLNAKQRAVTMSHRVVELSDAEFDLLKLFMQQPGELLNRENLFTRLRGIEYDGLDRSIDMRISTLRKKLTDASRQAEAEHEWIKTVRGKGYMLVADNC